MTTNAPSAVLRSEWTKVCTSRSTVAVPLLTLAATVAACAVTGAAYRNALDHHPERLSGTPRDFDPLASTLDVASYAQLGLLAFGVLLAGGEYGSGMIRVSLAAVPRRGLLLAAKAAACGAAALPVAAGAALLGFLAAQAALGPYGTTLGDGATVRGLLLCCGYLTFTTLLGLALGMLLRSTPLALGVLYALLIAVVPLAGALPGLEQGVRWLPFAIGGELFTAGYQGPGGGGPWGGLALVAGWTAALLTTSWLTLRRRDA